MADVFDQDADLQAWVSAGGMWATYEGIDAYSWACSCGAFAHGFRTKQVAESAYYLHKREAHG